MDRKLHNSLMAVVSSSALLVVGLLAAVPAQQSLDPQRMTAIVEAARANAPRRVDNAGTTEAPRRQTRSRGQSVQMPFFSFVPRS